MKIRVVGAGLLCALFFLPVTAWAADAGAAALDAAWVKAFKANDVEGLVACYAPDAVLGLPDMPQARGTEAIRATYKALLGANTAVDGSLINTTYKTSGDVSAGYGNYVLTLQPKSGGAQVVLKGRFIDVAKNANGKWAYVADLASNEPAPPAPAK
jgi:ketosteroid isomerase-like protein